MSALISFLGGSVFRMVFGEVSSYFTKKQDHEHEMERMKLQAESDAAQHLQAMESIRVQAELGVKTIQVQADADLSRIDAGAWAQAVSDVGKKTGIAFLDIWNGAVRPWLATMASILVVVQVAQHNWIMTDWDMELVGAILGVYVADRQLAKRGK